MLTDLTDTEIVEGEAFIQQTELVLTCFFVLLKSVNFKSDPQT